MGCSHDPANIQQTSSKCIQNTRTNAGRLQLDVCWKFAGRLLDRVNTIMLYQVSALMSDSAFYTISLVVAFEIDTVCRRSVGY